MAQFMGVVSGRARTSASRLGTKCKPITTKCNGWDVGVTCRASYEDGEDVIRVYATGGSNERLCPTLIAIVRCDGGNVDIEHKNG